MTSKWGKNKKVALEAIAECVIFYLFIHLFIVIYLFILIYSEILALTSYSKSEFK